MNVEQLLSLYDRVADAPDAVGKLRSFILDLAVRGKLADQDPADQPVSELVRQIATEKLRRTGARRASGSAPIRKEELPIEVPASWAWLRLSDIGSLSGGMTPSMTRSDYWDGDVVWLSPKDIKADEVSDSESKITTKGLVETRLEQYPPGSLFIVARSGILRRTFPVSINRVPAAANQDMKVLVPFVKGYERYLQIMFRGLTGFILRNLVKAGTTVQSLKYSEFEQQPFPLPPAAEQLRIVDKVDELMKLCDQLEHARVEREIARDRLAATSLTRLIAAEQDAYDVEARFALEALPALTARADQIRQLRQSILDLAMRGKLVPPDDKLSAVNSVPLQQAGKRRGQVVRPEASVPFDLPRTWAWRAIGTVAEQVTDGEHATPPRISQPQIPLVTAKNVRNGYMDYERTDWVSCATAKKAWSRCKPTVGDILMVCVGATTGRLTILEAPRDMVLVRSVALIRPNREVSARYLAHAIRSPLVQTQIWASVKVAAQPCLYINRIQSLLVPVPPMPEQERIVAKIDELIELCNELEASLTDSEDLRRRLLDALLSEALQSPMKDAA